MKGKAHPLSAFAKLALLASALLGSVISASAQVGGAYDLSWNTIDGGGWTFSTDGNYSLGGTTGQADAHLSSSGGSYMLQGGFWTPPGYLAHVPIVRKQP